MAAAKKSLSGYEVIGPDRTQQFSDPKSALAAAQLLPSAVVLVHDSGPSRIPPLQIDAGQITLRAAPNAEPVWILEDDAADSGRSLITTSVWLKLEGLHLKRVAGDAVDFVQIDRRAGLPSSLVSATGRTLEIVNCRFEFPEDRGPGCAVRAHGVRDCVVRNSEFRGEVALDWDRPHEGLLALQNCLVDCRTGVLMPAIQQSTESGLLLEQNIFLSLDPMAAMRPSRRLRDVPLQSEAVLNVHATQNIFVRSARVQRGLWVPLRNPDRMLRLHWRGTDNQFGSLWPDSEVSASEIIPAWQHLVDSLGGTSINPAAVQWPANPAEHDTSAAETDRERILRTASMSAAQPSIRGPGPAFRKWRSTVPGQAWLNQRFDVQSLRQKTFSEKD